MKNQVTYLIDADLTAKSNTLIYFIKGKNIGKTALSLFSFIAFFLVFFSGSLISQTQPVLPVDFESGTINYTFTDFDGGGTVKIANPQINGINTSANVARMIKSAGQVWGGSLIALAAPINFSVNKTFKVKVFMPRVGAKLLLKVENPTDPSINFEKEATGTVANAWEELTFDYSLIDATKQFQKLVFIFDLGTIGDGSPNFTYLFDDINLISGPPPPPADSTQMNLPVTFDIPYVNYGLVGFGGAEGSTIVVDPTLSTNKVAKVIKSATAETWAGTTVTALTSGVQTGFRTKIPFTTSEKKMNVRVWSPNSGIKIRLKVEDYLDNTKCVETEATSTIASGWEVLTFNFATPAPGTAELNLAYNYNKASIFFNFGVAGGTSGEKTYYFDDMKFGDIGPPPVILPVLPLDFESATIDYTFSDFDGGGTVKIANPQINGINTSANVARMIKGAGQVWGGSLIALASPINFSVNKTFKVKVFMPRVGAKLLLKVENQTDPSINFEKEVTGTVANAWQELTFDYSLIDVTKQYQKLVFIFDLGTAGDGSPNFTYLFDDVILASAPPPPVDSTQMNLPVTFDIPYVNYGLFGFGGAEASTIVVDPTLPSNKVAKVIKSATAETWAGTTVTAVTGGVQTGFSTKIPFTLIEKRMNVRVWSPNTGIKVRLKVEDFMDPGKCVETEATSTVANAWETLVFNFATPAPGTAELNLTYNYNKASIFFNFGVSGGTVGEKTYYFDDMKFGNASSAICKDVSVLQGWNILSVPVVASNMNGASIFPTVASAFFTFDNGYQSVTTLVNGKGYWAKFNSTTNVNICGNAVPTTQIPVIAGWNIIGGYDKNVLVSGITSSPSGIITSNFFEYNDGYTMPTSIVSGKGYWVKVSQNGNIILPNTVIAKTNENGQMKMDNWKEKIIITDNTGKTQTLYLTKEQTNLSQFELPPVPPAGISDVRFASNRFVENIIAEQIIKINGFEYPIKIKVVGTDLILKDNIDGKQINKNVKNGEEVVISNSQLNMLKVTTTEVPSQFSLSQNYPNPFNPSTIISYSSPVNSQVSLIVYDILGKAVETLINKEQEAGKYTIEFNATKYSSGIYYYELRAGDFRAIKKMMIVK